MNRPERRIFDVAAIADQMEAEMEQTVAGREPLLVERQTTHGNFVDNATISQSLKMILRASKKWEGLTAPQKESLDLICTKLARVITGNPDEPDHWKDIAGYAKLVEETL